MRKCLFCNKIYKPKSNGQKFCCKKCCKSNDYITNLEKRRATSLRYRNKNKKKAIKDRKKWSQKNKNKGKCSQCGKNTPVKLLQDCEICYFKSRAANHLGTRKRWIDLKNIYENQNGICPYTGKNIVPGKMSLDHIIPPKKGGTNKNNNLQWVRKDINMIKNHMTHKQFIKLCKDIAGRF